MRSTQVRILVVLMLAAGISTMAQKDAPVVRPAPPDTPVRDVKETFFGTEVQRPVSLAGGFEESGGFVVDARAKRLHPRRAGQNSQSR